MKKFIITLLTTSFLTVGLYGQATSETQRQRPQRVQLTEAQQAIGKAMAEDKGIQKIREKAIKDMIAYLVKKGHSKEDAKAVVENGAKAAERFRSGGMRGVWGNRNRPDSEGSRGKWSRPDPRQGRDKNSDRPQRERRPQRQRD